MSPPYNHNNNHSQTYEEPIIEYKTNWIAAWQPILSMLVLLIGGIVWGIKLEGRIDSLQQRVNDMQKDVSKGILPVTEERVKSIQEHIEVIRNQQISNITGLTELSSNVNKLTVEITELKTKMHEKYK